MYAIIEDSGTQIRAAEGDRLTIDLRDLPDDAATVRFDRVLMVGGTGEPAIGAPYVAGASVEAEILERDAKGEKIDVIKFKRRKGYRRKQGHRQRHMIVKVTRINAG
ncbi:MAG: 50S ribosomal protein L21 [Planctomycetota bacterium]|nr:MAG: 50S ribosomal protein L21 [Planctomycetota bacterium]